MKTKNIFAALSLTLGLAGYLLPAFAAETTANAWQARPPLTGAQGYEIGRAATS